jgi:hypothetical protein
MYRMIRCVQLGQQGPHLLQREALMRSHRTVAGGQGGDGVPEVLDGRAVGGGHELLGHVGHQGADRAGGEVGGQGGHGDGAATEVREFDAEPGEHLRPIQQHARLTARQVQDLGNQQRL